MIIIGGLAKIRMTDLSVPSGVDPEDRAYVENPATGERFRFHARPDDPVTEPVELDIWATPDMSPLAAHVHPKQDETFVVNAGTVEVSRNGVETILTDGETLTVDAGTPHTWSNAGKEELHLTVRFQPGLQTEAFLRDLAALAHRGEVKANGAPSLLQVAALYNAYGYDLLHLASPPLPVQKVVLGALAPIAGGLGYRANPVGDAVTQR
jgi:mannose-6-phosphate isomerase-like protein (cupin superfamily)